MQCSEYLAALSTVAEGAREGVQGVLCVAVLAGAECSGIGAVACKGHGEAEAVPDVVLLLLCIKTGMVHSMVHRNSHKFGYI